MDTPPTGGFPVAAADQLANDAIAAVLSPSSRLAALEDAIAQSFTFMQWLFPQHAPAVPTPIATAIAQSATIPAASGTQD